MKPTWVRATFGSNGSPWIRSRSKPGAWKPVQQTVMRWVIEAGSTAAAAKAALVARRARGPASAEKRAMRSAVVGLASA